MCAGGGGGQVILLVVSRGGQEYLHLLWRGWGQAKFR